MATLQERLRSARQTAANYGQRAVDATRGPQPAAAGPAAGPRPAAPARPSVMYGTADGRVAQNLGDAQAYDRNRQRPGTTPHPAQPAQPAQPAAATPATPPRRGIGARALRFGAGAAATGLATEASDLARIHQEQGGDAMRAEAPRALGRAGMTWAGVKAGSAFGGKRGPLGAAAGGLVGGYLGYHGSETIFPRPEIQTRGGNPFAANAGEPASDREPAAGGREPYTLAPPRGEADTGAYSPDPGVSLAPGRGVAPGQGYIHNPATGQTRRVQVSQEEREASAAAEANRVPTVTAAPSTASTVRDTTARTTQGIDRAALNTRNRATSALLNPMGNDAELVRRLNNTLTSARFRGSPSSRRMAAQPFLEALGVANDADRGGLRGHIDALGQGAESEALANESSALRRDAADQFNVSTAEARRASDMDVGARLMDLQQRAAQGDAEAAREYQTWITDRYDQHYEFAIKELGLTPEQAQDYTYERAVREGLVPVDEAPAARDAALDRSARLERQFEDATRPGLFGIQGWARRNVANLSGGDPTMSGSYTFDEKDWERGGPSGLQQWLATRFGRDQVVTNRVTGEQAIMPRDRTHERTVAERGIRRNRED